MNTGAALALVGLLGLGWLAVLHRLLGDSEPQLRPDAPMPLVAVDDDYDVPMPLVAVDDDYDVDAELARALAWLHTQPPSAERDRRIRDGVRLLEQRLIAEAVLRPRPATEGAVTVYEVSR